MKKQNTFLIYAAISALSVLFLVGSVNALIDPFGVYRFIDLPNFNSHKPAINIEDSKGKLQAVNIIKPQSLVLGSSRTETALDPNSQFWLNSKKPAYNLSLVSANMSVVNDYFSHANSIRAVKSALLGVDFVMFKETIRDKEVSTRQNAHKKNVKSSSLDINFYYLFSLDALKASIKTVLEQSVSNNQDYLSNGQRSPASFNKQQKKIGHRKMFHSQEKKFIFKKQYIDSSRGRYIFYENGTASTNIQAFSDLIDYCSKNSIELQVFINPIHARQQEIIYQEGQWQTFEQWKRELLNIIEKTNAMHPRAKPIQLWDFSGFNTITMEPVPAINDTQSSMKWFWESSHFTITAGNLMLKRIYNTGTEDVPNDFGVKLSSDNMELHLKELRLSREKYNSLFHDEVENIKKLLELREKRFQRMNR